MANAIFEMCGIARIQGILAGRHPVAILGSFLPSQALAEVCDKERPNWDGTPVTALQEALYLFSTLPALALLIATAIALKFRSQWGGLTVVVLWALFVSAVAFLKDTTIDEFARAEGCLGSPTLFIALVAAICAGTILYTLPRETRL